MKSLKAQYERFPYPPIPLLALPSPGEGRALEFPRDQRGIRILIVGCGTLEPVVVAQRHPEAREIVAVDLSQSSIQIAKKRLFWLKIARLWRKLPPVRWEVGDATNVQLGSFDYIIASNVLHHSPDPAKFLVALTRQLKPGGLIRIVTYPKASRLWMRKTSEWLKSEGFSPESPDLVRKVRSRVYSKLALSDPRRSTFESQPETRKKAGLIDAFFNVCENPLSPLEWQNAFHEAGLRLIREAQDDHSRSDFLDSALLDPSGLSCWEKLQILDDTWELCSNLVLWLEKTSAPESDFPDLRKLPENPIQRADLLLRKAGSSIELYQAWLRANVGPRTHPLHPDELLRGLSLAEYDLTQLKL